MLAWCARDVCDARFKLKLSNSQISNTTDACEYDVSCERVGIERERERDRLNSRQINAPSDWQVTGTTAAVYKRRERERLCGCVYVSVITTLIERSIDR